MKKLFILFTFLSTVALAQEPAKMVVFTAPMLPVGQSNLEPLNIKFNQATVHELFMGMHSLYLPDSDVPGSNIEGTKTKVIVFQTSISQGVTDAQLLQISAAIKVILRGDTVTTPPPPVTVIDTVDADAGTFSAGWTKALSSTANWHNGTLAFSNVTGASITYKHPVAFKRVEIWAERKGTHGKVQIFLDNVAVGEPVDLYSPNYEIPYLVKGIDVTPGIHEIKYVITGEKNAASSNAYGLLDYFRFVR